MAVDRSLKIELVEKGGAGVSRVVHMRLSGAEAKDLQIEKIDGHRTLVIHGESAYNNLVNAFKRLPSDLPSIGCGQAGEESAASVAGNETGGGPLPAQDGPQDEIPFGADQASGDLPHERDGY